MFTPNLINNLRRHIVFKYFYTLKGENKGAVRFLRDYLRYLNNINKSLGHYLIMTKPYDWKEIESILKKELSKTNAIMTFGTIGSTNIEHDIDLIITKKPSATSSKFYKEIHNIFDIVDNYLKEKYGARVMCFSLSTEEVLMASMSKTKKIDLPFHMMIYVTYSQMKKDWSWTMLKRESVEKLLLNNYNCLLGNTKDIFSKEFQKERYYESIFNYIYLYDKTHANLSKELTIEIANKCYDYLYRKRLGLESPKITNEKEIRKYLYKLCDIVDELDKKEEIK